MENKNPMLKKYNLYTILASFILIISAILFTGNPKSEAYQPPTPIPQNASLQEWITVLTPTTQCALPCWWNIIPGATTLDETEFIILNKFEGVETDRLVINSNQENMAATQLNMRLENTPSAISGGVMSLYFDATNDVVKTITLTSMEDSMVGSSETILAWEAFSIINTLQNYGTPDVVQTYLEQTSDGLRGNSLWLYWEDYGLAVEYREDLVVPSAGIPNAPICYNLENLDYLRVWLQEPNNLNSLLATTSTFSLGIKNLAEISDISNQEFRQILLNNNGCLPTNLPVDWDRTACDYSPAKLADLRTAIINANNTNDVSNICLANNATYSISSANSGLNGLPIVTKNIKFIGNGATITRQSGSPLFGFFEVNVGGSLTLENL